MKLVTAHLKSTPGSPYSQSRHYVVEKNQGEGYDDYYRRTWRNHMHTDETGSVVIPPGSFKNCLAESAKFLGIPIPGKGKANYTKHFEAGVLCFNTVQLGIKASDVQFEALFLPSDGKRGGQKRVDKYYPYIPSWEADVEFVVVDDTVIQRWVGDKDITVFEHVLDGAGKFIGIGRFRPRNNGHYGRFNVTSVKIAEAA
jgi:hypothetical protein